MISELKITTGDRSGVSYLKECYVTRPFKIANTGVNRADPALYLMLMTASPGMLDGDHYRMHVTVSKHTRLQLQTQAYQRLYCMQRGAVQEMQVKQERGSVFSYVPHPLAPHAGADFEGRTRIELEEDCRLIWGEIITCGRKLSGEAFRFKRLHTVTELYYQGKLLLKDNLLLEPEHIPVEAFGQLEGFSHQATLIYCDTHQQSAVTAESLLALLEAEDGLAYGVSQAAGPALVLRMLGQGGEQLLNCLRKLENFLWHTKKETIYDY
jgi:urease accessory protein